MDKQYKELAQQTTALAAKTKGADKQIVQALSNQIKAIGDLDTQIEELNKSIKDLNHVTTRLMTRQIWLIITQTIIAVAIGWAAIRISG